MTNNEAKQLSAYHTFTKTELRAILKLALKNKPKTFWIKRNRIQKLVDNGAYFNTLVKQLNGTDTSRVFNLIQTRILVMFGEYSRIQVPKIEKNTPEKPYSEVPKM